MFNILIYFNRNKKFLNCASDVSCITHQRKYDWISSTSNLQEKFILPNIRFDYSNYACMHLKYGVKLFISIESEIFRKGDHKKGDRTDYNNHLYTV